MFNAPFTRRLATLIAIVAAVSATAVACGGRSLTAESLAEKCDSADYSRIDLSSDKKAIEFNFRPGTEEAEGVFNCLLEKSSAPSSVNYRVGETRGIDGTQEAEWDGWKMYWSYSGSSKSATIHLEEA